MRNYYTKFKSKLPTEIFALPIEYNTENFILTFSVLIAKNRSPKNR